MNLQSEHLPTDSCRSLTITNRESEVERVVPWLQELADQFHLPERTVFKLDLVLNEALPNIIHYAYQDPFQHDILVRLENNDSHVLLEIIDDGTPFDPFAKEDDFHKPASLEQAEVDGRGLHMINFFTDAREYRRVNNNNIMRLTISKAPKAN